MTCYQHRDENDFWRLEGGAGGGNSEYWSPGEAVRLVHVKTNHALHSHPNAPFGSHGQQEVTGYEHRDQNDLWIGELA